jgi:hypothetical protein
MYIRPVPFPAIAIDGNDHGRVVFSSPESYPNLERLTIHRCVLGPDFVLPILTLKILIIPGNSLGPNYILPKNYLSNITTLDISNNLLGPTFTLPNKTYLPNITSLDISHNQLGPTFTLPYKGYPTLTSLNISHNHLGPTFTLSQHDFPSLIILDIQGNYTPKDYFIGYNIENCTIYYQQAINNWIVNRIFPSVTKLLLLVEPDWSKSLFDLLPNELICHIIGLTEFPVRIAHVCRLFYWCTYTTTTAQTRTDSTDRRSLWHLHMPLFMI